jgi:hypothetical protein
VTTAQEYPAGWLTQFRRGVVAGFVLLAVAVLLTAVPTFLAWLAPGTDTTSAGSALKAAVLIAVSGNHGGLVLDGTAVTLSPMLITLMLGWLAANHARRLDSTTGFAGLVVGYTLITAIAASWAQLGSTRLPFGRSVLAAFLFVLVVGGAARFGPTVWAGLPARWCLVARAAAAACAVYLLAGALLAAAALAGHFSQAGDLQNRLMGGAAGLPIALLGIAATPNATLSGVGYLTGVGFHLGGLTHISPFSVQRGTLPAFPLLAAVPSGAPGWIGVTAAILTALAAGWVVHRILRTNRESAQPAAAGVLDSALTAAMAGSCLGLLGMLAAGSMGTRALRQVGVTGWLVALAAFAILSASSLFWLGVTLLRARRGADGHALALPFARKVGEAAAQDEPVESETAGRRLRSTG